MKALLSKIYNISPLIALVFILSAAGCAKEHDEDGRLTGDEITVRFEVRLPSGTQPVTDTRGMSDTEESAISTIDVFHFVKESDNKYRGVTADPVNGTFTTGSPAWINAKLQTRPGKDSRLVFVINAREAGNYGYTKQMELNDFLDALVFENQGEWNSASGSATPLPMYCITGDVEIKKGLPNNVLDNNGKPFGIIRMHAKVNVSQKSTITNFTLKTVCVFNRKTKGYIAYNETKWDATDPDDPFATAPHIPSTTGNVYEPSKPYFGIGTNVANPDYGKIINKQYIFEADNANESDKLKKTALVIGGIYDTDTDTTYYRVDIDVTGGNILRNHLYDVEIQSVSGRGYSTAENAFTGASEASELSAIVTPWNNYTDDIYLGRFYYLAFYFCDNVELDYNATSTGFTVQTNYDRTDQGYPAGIWIDYDDIEFNPQVAAGDEWIQASDALGTNGDISRDIQLIVSKNESGNDRSAKVWVKAGNMSKAFHLTQRANP